MNDEDIVNKAKEIWAINKLSTSALKKTLHYIKKTVDLPKLLKGGYSYDNLLKICANSIIRYPAIGAILTLYGGDSNKEFCQNVQYNIDKIKNIRSIIKSGDLPFINATSTECINLIYDMIKDESLYQLTAKNIFEKLYEIYKPQETYVNLKILVAYTCFFLDQKNTSLSQELRSYYDSFINKGKQTTSDEFSNESLWKKNLIEHLKKINTDRLTKTSAYPEITLRKILSRNVMLLRHIEKYIKKFYPHLTSSIDELQWFFNNVTINELKQCIIWIANFLINPQNDRVKSKHTKHHGYDFIKTTIVFFRDRIPEYMKCKKDLYSLNLAEIIGKVNDMRDIPLETIRRHFYKHEIDKIMKSIEDDPKYTLIFTILIEVGLRVGAIATLQVKHFINYKGEYLDKGRKLEKGKKYRTFPISDNMKEKIRLYLTSVPDLKNNIESYLFPSKLGKHISTDAIRNKLIRITKNLDIYGHHVHPHAFRHTIVNNLMAEGNKLENVSKFMGHSNIATTEQYYWTTELENIIPVMNIPWLKNSNKKELYDDVKEAESKTLSIDLLVSILGVYHGVLDNEQKHIIQTRIPNIEEIFANICEYSMTNSLTEETKSVKDFI